MNNNSRIFGLDILRALAILLVVTGHSYYFLPASFKNNVLSVFPDGVAIFFVLSGYLIGGILIRTLERNGASFGNLLNFWVRRWLRTLPVYFLILLILCVLSYFFVPGFTILTVWKYFIFCQNFNTPQPAFFSEVWSLSIEEWFYLLIPLLIFTIVGLFKLTPKKALLVTIAGVIVCTILYRYYRYLSIEVTSVEIWDTMFRKQVVTRMDSLMFGVAGAWFYYYYPSFWIRYSKPAFITALLLLVVTRIITVQYLSGSIFYYCNLSFILVSITVLLLLPFLSQLRTGKGPLYRFVTYTSLISYSMYLTHVSLVMFFIINKIGFLHSAQPARMVIRYILYWGVTYGLSILLYKYFELPFMAMRPRANKEAGSVAGAG